MPAEQIGYEAAALLEHLLGRARAPARPLLLPPVGVVTRRSTDVLAPVGPRGGRGHPLHSRSWFQAARDLLIQTDLPMTAVAERAGFSAAKQLSVVFREEIGLTPTAYRRRFRSGN